MSSGIGVKGTLGRCYPFYADLRKCVVSSDDQTLSLCLPKSENGLISLVCRFVSRPRRKLIAHQECAGQRMKTTLSAFMVSRKRLEFYKLPRNVSDGRSLESLSKSNPREMSVHGSNEYFYAKSVPSRLDVSSRYRSDGCWLPSLKVNAARRIPNSSKINTV